MLKINKSIKVVHFYKKLVKIVLEKKEENDNKLIC